MVRSIKGKHLAYFESTLQLRNVNKEIIDFAEMEIKKAGVHIAKIKKLKTGLDYFLSDNSFTRALGKKLQKRYGGQLVNTATLFSEKKGKKLYRSTVLFRTLPHKKGDLVNYKGEEYHVRSVSKEIMLQHSKTGKKERVKYKEMSEIRTT